MSYTLPAPTAGALKPCSICNICNGKSCVVIPSIASPQHLCMLHYYTTGAHRSHPQSHVAGTNASLFVEIDQMEEQLPKVQDLFAEAFIDLQRDIGEESVRVFQLASAADDPLALLLESKAPAQSSRSTLSQSFRKQKNKGNSTAASKKKTTNNDIAGGVISQTVLSERLRKLKDPRQHEGFAITFGSHFPTVHSRKRPFPTSHTAGGKATKQPYKQKKRPSVNVWNQILDCPGHQNKDNGEMRTKMKWEDMEKEMMDNITGGGRVLSKNCSACGSSNVDIVNADITSRSNDSTKGEVWGNKNRSETVVEKCYCVACGNIWHDE